MEMLKSWQCFSFSRQNIFAIFFFLKKHQIDCNVREPELIEKMIQFDNFEKPRKILNIWKSYSKAKTINIFELKQKSTKKWCPQSTLELPVFCKLIAICQ